MPLFSMLHGWILSGKFSYIPLPIFPHVQSTTPLLLCMSFVSYSGSCSFQCIKGLLIYFSLVCIAPLFTLSSVMEFLDCFPDFAITKTIFFSLCESWNNFLRSGVAKLKVCAFVILIDTATLLAPEVILPAMYWGTL